VSNIINFVRGKLVPYQGLQTLIPSFYRSINHSTETPISADLAITVAEVEETVFAQAGKLHLSTSPRPSNQVNITQQEKVLVTGSTGYVGLQVVRQLVKDGYYVRALVRALSHTHSLEQLGVELIYGDIRDFDNVSEAAEGMDIVVHMAAALGGAADFVLDCCVEGTKNVAEAARLRGAKRVIYMSSMSVYDFFRMKNGHEITAESPLEESPELRGLYSLAKRRGEDVALLHLEDKSPAWTILRPSLIVGGNGRNIFSPAGVRLGNILICPSSPHKNLRLIHVEDVGEVISMFIKNEGTSRHLYNLSDPDSLTLRDYVDNFLRESGYKNIKAIYVPYWLAYIGFRAIMAIRKMTGKGPSLNMRRLAYLYRNVSVRSRDFNEQTGWQPREGILKRLREETKIRQTLN
jgi:nucleoside-diphosphate-sugar epimerase